jgi:hypothetical protein
VGGHGKSGRSQLGARPIEVFLGNEQVEQIKHEELAMLGRQVVGLPELLIDRRHNAAIGKLGQWRHGVVGNSHCECASSTGFGKHFDRLVSSASG